MEYVKSSDAGAFYLAHEAAMKPCEALPPEHSFALPLVEYSLPILRDLAAAYNVGKAAIVVIEWPTAYEVRRLPDGANVRMFYKYWNETPQSMTAREAARPGAVKAPVLSIKTFLKVFKSDPLEKMQSYDKNLTAEMQNEGVFSYALLQRRLGSVAVFKNNIDGAKETIKKALDELEEECYIEAVSIEEAKSQYGTHSKLYRILKEDE